MALPYLSVVLDDQSLHGIQDQAVIQVWTTRCIPYLDPNAHIIFNGLSQLGALKPKSIDVFPGLVGFDECRTLTEVDELATVGLAGWLTKYRKGNW